MTVYNLADRLQSFIRRVNDKTANEFYQDIGQVLVDEYLDKEDAKSIDIEDIIDYVLDRYEERRPHWETT